MGCRWKFTHSGIMSDFAWNWFRAGQQHGQCRREVLPAAAQQDRICTGDSRQQTGMQGNIDFELMSYIILILPTALAVSDQDLVNSMMVHDDELMTYDVPFSKGTSSTPSADLGCEDDIDYEIFTEVALQMADSKG